VRKHDESPQHSAGSRFLSAPERRAGGQRSCYNKNGSPKARFTTKKLAERAIPKTSVRLRPYACSLHGWHLGH